MLKLGRHASIIMNSLLVYAVLQNLSVFYSLIRFHWGKKKDGYLGEEPSPLVISKAQAHRSRNKATLWKQVISVFTQHFLSSQAQLHAHKSSLQIHSESSLLPGGCDRLVLCRPRDGLMISATSWHAQEI